MCESTGMIESRTIRGKRFVTFSILALVQLAAVASGKSYYIDPVNGSDKEDGRKESPWKSFTNIISYYNPSYRPHGWVELAPGDCIYLMNGVYSEILHPGGWKKGPTSGGSFVAYFRGKRGDKNKQFQIKPYPGHKPIIDTQCKGIGISIFQSGNWEIEGIEVRNAYGRGISLTESKEIKLHDVHIHDTDGVDNNNIAGLYITDCRDVEIHSCIFNDNYDRTCADTDGKATENSTNVVIFGGMQGGNIEIHDCLIYQSLPLSHKLSGGGIKYKHASRIPEATFHVHHNTFKNCKFFAFGTGTANTHFHHNLIVGGGGISSRDFGGVTHQVNQVFEHNTLYDTSGFQMNPTTRWRNKTFPDDPKNIVFKNNIVYETRDSYSQERGTVTVGTYISDELYHIILRELRFENNCYYNPKKAIRFNIAAGFNYKEGYGEGDFYSLKQWQTKYGYDLNSHESNPMFIDAAGGDFRLQLGAAYKNMGKHVTERR
ncbi:MAG: right-handed parallel beta-helix repeat-containing protein [Planctomycetota bacterium]|jgi:hypothetical protein